MNLQHLQVFLTVVEHKNFSTAGKKLHLSQPTVTHIIKQLEQELETRLFDRTTHSVKLTETGELLVPYAKKILELQEEVRRNIALKEQTVSGTFFIGASLTTAEVVVPKLVRDYQRLYPQVRIYIEVNNSEIILQGLQTGRLHFGIIEAPLTSPSLVIEPFMTDELICITSSLYPLLDAPEEHSGIALKELAHLPLIMREKGSGTRLVLEEALARHNIQIEPSRIIVELNSTEAIKEMVVNGLGVAVLSRHLIKKELALRLVKAYPLQPERLERSFYYAYLPETPPRPTVMAMLNLIEAQFPCHLDPTEQ